EQALYMDKAARTQYLDPGQLTEQLLGSVDYAVWHCAHCGAHRLEKSERWLSSFSHCVQCGYRTLQTSKQTLERPTYSATGLEEVTGRCEQCGYHHVETKILPML